MKRSVLHDKPAREVFAPQKIFNVAKAPIQYIPATILGILLNLLDGVSYGLIMFPTTPIFADFGGIGVSMFFVSVSVRLLSNFRKGH